MPLLRSSARAGRHGELVPASPSVCPPCPVESGCSERLLDRRQRDRDHGLGTATSRGEPCIYSGPAKH